MFCTKKDFFVQSIRNPAGKSKDSDQFSAQRQVHHRFGTVGGVLPEHCPAAMSGGDVVHFATKEEALQTVKEQLQSNTSMLIKASHAMRFEALVEALKKTYD